jgi:putative tryptophan/tyrosine transport system substrate-binding protein
MLRTRMIADLHGVHLSRRRFVQDAGVAGLGLLAGCGRLSWPAPQPARVPRIGVLVGGARSARPQAIEVFQQAMRDHGYVEGQNIAFEIRDAGGLPGDQQLLEELVGLPVEVIITTSTGAARTARATTDVIPIVMARSGVDPVSVGLITSLARPGGNVTGLTAITQELSGKRLELLRQTVPSLTRVAALWNPTSLEKAVEFREVEAAARTLGVELQSLEIRAPGELDAAFQAALRENAHALITLEDSLTMGLVQRIADLAVEHGLPAIYESRDWVEGNGGLMAYGIYHSELWQRAASYVDKILKGASPAELPVERPMRFEFVINLRTAQALGLTIPQHVLLQATEIVQ